MHFKKKNYLLMKNTAIILYHILMRLCGLLAYKQLNFVFFYSNIGIFFYIEMMVNKIPVLKIHNFSTPLKYKWIYKLVKSCTC